MCLLPCWPCGDILLEGEPKRKKVEGVLMYDPNANTVVKVTGKIPVSSTSFLSVTVYEIFWTSWELEMEKFSVVFC